MMHRVLILLALLWLQIPYTRTFGQEMQPDAQDFPGADLTEQQWRARVEDA